MSVKIILVSSSISLLSSSLEISRKVTSGTLQAGEVYIGFCMQRVDNDIPSCSVIYVYMMSFIH